MQVISTQNLTKIYSSNMFLKEGITALDDFSFEVNRGEIFGLLGPNGAGKTTLIKVLLGIVNRTAGAVKIFDKELTDVSYKSKVGFLPENHKFPGYLTGEQVISYFGKLSGLSDSKVKQRIDSLLDTVNMTKWRSTKMKKYSKGMMQRIGLAQSLINDPEIVFLDEPTDGVDPIGRKEIRDMLLTLREQGKTVFLNSHLLSEVELICDRVAILNKGKLLKIGSVEEITTSQNTYRFFTSELNDAAVNDLLLKFKVILNGKTEFLYQSDNDNALNTVIDYLREKGILIRSFYQEKNTLESMFINLIGEAKENVN